MTTFPEGIARPQSAWRRGFARCLVALAIPAFLWLNIRTAMSVSPWVDEVMQVDAGVNLYLGKGWVSTAWQSQSQHEFWAANNPLYTFLVYLWIRIFGFFPVVVRSLNYVLAIVITWLIVDTCKRAKFTHSLWAQILLSFLLICDQAFTFVYRSGRADLVTMLVVTLLFRIYVLVQSATKRRVLLFLCATLMLASGLHAIPYAVLLLCLDYYVSRKLRVPDLIAVGWGCLAGGVILAIVFFSQNSLMAYALSTFASGYNILGAGMQAAVIRDANAINRFVSQLEAMSPLRVLQTIGLDRGSSLLIAYLLCLTVLLWRASHSMIRFASLAGLIAAVLIPYGMVAVGRYSFYYAWMGAAPVAVAFTIALEQCWLARKRFLLGGGLVTAYFAILLGMPSEMWQEAHKTPPDDYTVVERTLRQEASAGDVVYGDPVFYYAAKAANIPFFSVTYAGGRGYRRMTDAERAQVSIVLVASDRVAESFEKLGGEWVRRSVFHSPYGYPINVFRRAAAGNGVPER